MDREFYKRIAKNRVDASLQSPTNPVPDYYGAYFPFKQKALRLMSISGEKIGSLHQYRHVCASSLLERPSFDYLVFQWLRDQAKYKQKVLLPEE
jgi:import inner membrane translocase subunit TIM23